jgi:hypothetical protein
MPYIHKNAVLIRIPVYWVVTPHTDILKEYAVSIFRVEMWRFKHRLGYMGKL